MAVKKGGLGRGLDTLFSENATDEGKLLEIDIHEIEPNKEQPRKDFDEEALNELADSISVHGLLQPIVVRPRASGRYEIIAGERRWRACRIAGVTRVPVVIKELDEQSAAEVALVENLQREDLNAYEEALGYSTLIEKFGLTQENAASRVGKSRAAVANALRLLKLDKKMLEALREGKITAGHARALLSVEGEKRDELFLLALKGASVRNLEALASKKPTTAKKKQENISNFEKEVALSLKEVLHRPVKITGGKNGKGSLTIEFYSKEELSDFAKRLAGKDN